MKPKMSLHGKGEVLPKWIEDSDDVMISLVKIIPKKKKKRTKRGSLHKVRCKIYFNYGITC